MGGWLRCQVGWSNPCGRFLFGQMGQGRAIPVQRKAYPIFDRAADRIGSNMDAQVCRMRLLPWNRSRMKAPVVSSSLLTLCLPLAVICFTATRVCAQAAPEDSALRLVKDVVWNEIHEEAADHSRWMYRDAYKSPTRDTVKLVIQTSEANLAELVEDHGQPPSAQAHQADLDHMDQLLNDPALRAKQRRDEAHDGQQADDLMRMLPSAFLWREVSREDGKVTLAYQPNPTFAPPNMSAKVMGSMSGTLVVSEREKRVVSLNGRLMRPVQFAWGILGHLNAGGTFQIMREEVAPHIWQITQTHVHISGHALFFKTIGDQEDETTSNYKPVPDDVDGRKALQMIRDGRLARELGVSLHTGD